jgi:hypothetical protein
MLVVIKVDTHNSSAVVPPFAKRLRDYDSNGLQGYTGNHATRPMAEMPCSDGDGFCLAAPLAIVQVTRMRLGVRLQCL